MTREVTSKHIDGIADLVVVAPIREGFIDAYENVTFETRLRIIAEALHYVRVSAREHESLAPFSDTTERILTLLDFRIGIIDQDLLQFHPKTGLASRRYLFLAATFDGSLEEYMRRIWDPLGVFLDLLFCNCEGYKPAGDHSFAEYFDWVRSAQVDSAIFYASTGLAVRDQLYLRNLERLQRELHPPAADLALARMTMPDPEVLAAADRAVRGGLPAHGLGLEALNVLYRLADYYPPDRTDPSVRTVEASSGARAVSIHTYAEGRYLLRAARSLLLGWESTKVPPPLRKLYEEPLAWFEGKGLRQPGDLDPQRPVLADPPFTPSEVQIGILGPVGTPDRLVRHGVLLLMTIIEPELARLFIKSLPISYEGAPPPETGLYYTIAFTADGLKRIGLYQSKLDDFPKEFREGMEKRSGLLGDQRENHPRRWALPERNWPPLEAGATLPRPPVEMGEVDFILQLRYAPPPGETGDAALRAEMERLDQVADSGVVIAAYEPMVSFYGRQGGQGGHPGDTFGHFDLRDGISQPNPRPDLGAQDQRGPDDVRVGEILCGFRNDRGDEGPETAPRDELQRNGSFLAVRKLEQRVETYFQYLETESQRIAQQHGIAFTAADLAARLLGRHPDGTPLAQLRPGGPNDFDYKDDPGGDLCPHASHVRRTHPRTSFLGRPTPRIMRRGMSFGAPGSPPGTARGIMFMAYAASIAEQFEPIQRWVNGGSSSGVGSANNDPLVGVRPAKGNAVYRFVVDGKVIRTVLPTFVKLHWGLYLFAPSRTALKEIAGFQGSVREVDEPRETRGKALMQQLSNLDEATQRAEWKRVLDDFDTKDLAERNRSPDIWSAIRYYHGGSYRLPFGEGIEKEIKRLEWVERAESSGQADPTSVVLVASHQRVEQVLSDAEAFSVAIQGRRLHDTSGDIYVAMQPDDRYREESGATNEIMFEATAEDGFATGYSCARAVLDRAVQAAQALGRGSFKVELRRDFLMPSLGAMCTRWFGLPDGEFMENGPWNWAKDNCKARCPGDFLAPSRHAFYPDPSPALADYALRHGKRINEAGHAFVAKYPEKGTIPGTLSAKMQDRIEDQDLLARNIIGMMIGMLAPADGNLRGVLYEWLTERTLWRHQAALRRAAGDGPATYEAAMASLLRPISRAMCKRPAPDLLVRLATRDYWFEPTDPPGPPDVRKGDVVIVGLVSATQRSLMREAEGDVSIVFGGDRTDPQPADKPVHACPAYKLIMGGMTGILTALLDVGRIKAMPSSLIVEISDWPRPSPSTPPPAPPS